MVTIEQWAALAGTGDLQLPAQTGGAGLRQVTPRHSQAGGFDRQDSLQNTAGGTAGPTAYLPGKLCDDPAAELIDLIAQRPVGGQGSVQVAARAEEVSHLALGEAVSGVALRTLARLAAPFLFVAAVCTFPDGHNFSY